MKTNYKQSQAAPHAKPIFTVSRNDSTLYVLPAYLAGAVMIRLQHIADGVQDKRVVRVYAARCGGRYRQYADFGTESLSNAG